MKDQELFDLCESVYKATGWDGGKQFAYDTTYADRWLRYIADFPDGTREKDLTDMVPLYDSDYLLEKLPAVIDSREYKGELANLITRKEFVDPDWRERGVVHFAWYDVYHEEHGLADFGVHADTPLKALLKLVIAIHDAGELPHS